MAKYDALTAHLRGLDQQPWTASLAEVERVLGFELPASARTWYAWWANQPRAQSKAWLDAGYRVINVDLDKQCITFTANDGASRSEAAVTAPLSIAEAKAGLARQFNVLPEQIEIIIRG